MSQTATKVVAADWWTKKDDDDLVSTLSAVFTMVRDENQWRTDKDEYHWGLYEGTGEGTRLKSRKNLTYLNATLPDNVCKMGTDTLTAKVAATRPIPQVITDKGNYKHKRRARKIRQFLRGEFRRQKLHEELSSVIIRDALVARGGVVHVFRNGRRPKIERVHSWRELYTDDWDAEFGSPMTMFRLRTLDRVVAMRKLGKTPEMKQAIKEAGYFSSSTRHVIRDEDRSSTVERVEILEAWYRCADHDDDDPDHECTGRHVMICSNKVLFDEPWEHDYFPFAILHYDAPVSGFWGTGMVQTLEGYQCNIDKANEKLDDSYDKSGTLVLLRDGGGVFKSDIVDGIRVAHVRPGPYEPTVADLDLVNEHMRMRSPELIERALNAVGVSQMSAQSKKPAGVDAAVALQTLDDIESARHIVFGRRFEAWCMRVGELLIDVIKEIAEEYGDYEVRVKMRGGYLPLKWKDVVVDGFELEMQSVGQLAFSLAGRIEKLKAMFEAGEIDGDTFWGDIDNADLQSEIETKMAPRLLVDEIIEAMLDYDGTAANDNIEPDGYIAPSEYLPLDWAHERAHLRKLEAEMEGAGPEVLALLKRWIDDLDYLIAKRDGKDPLPMSPAGGPVDPMAPAPMPPVGPPPPPGGGMPMDPMLLPQATVPGGDQLMQPPPGLVPPVAA